MDDTKNNNSNNSTSNNTQINSDEEVNKRLDEAGVVHDISDNTSAITGQRVLTDAAGIEESPDITDEKDTVRDVNGNPIIPEENI